MTHLDPRAILRSHRPPYGKKIPADITGYVSGPAIIERVGWIRHVLYSKFEISHSSSPYLSELIAPERNAHSENASQHILDNRSFHILLQTFSAHFFCVGIRFLACYLFIFLLRATPGRGNTGQLPREILREVENLPETFPVHSSVHLRSRRDH